MTTETVNPRTAPPRGKFASLSDDEMTNVIPSKAIDSALESARAASPRPAAGMPPAAASSGRTQLRGPGPSSAPMSRPGGANRSGKFAAIDEEEEDGRTVVRGAPKIVKRAPGAAESARKMGMPTSPTTISPAAVIKATLDAARAGAARKNGDHLMAPPPKDLLEDMADLLPHPADGPGSEHTKIMDTTGASSGGGSRPPLVGGPTMPLHSQGLGQGSLPPSSVRPLSAAPPPMMHPNASGGFPVQNTGPWQAQYNGPVPSGSVSVPGVAMPAPPPSIPAHFMVPQAPFSDARIDPPGTSITARTRVSGRPAMSWAVALMAFGLFVGVGAFAVMKGNNGDGVMETSASFVDPARAGQAKAAAAVQQPAATPVAVPAVPAAPEQVGVPGVAIPAAPASPPATVAAALGVAAPGTVAAPAVVQPPVAVAAAPAPPPAVAQPAAAQPVAAAPRQPATHTARPSAPAPAARPAEEPVAAAAPTAKPSARGGKPAAGGKPASGDPGVDEEQKKALKALQESQLESTF